MRTQILSPFPTFRQRKNDLKRYTVVTFVSIVGVVGNLSENADKYGKTAYACEEKRLSECRK